MTWDSAWVSLGVAAVSAPLVYAALLKMNSRQTVSAHVEEHKQKQGTPTMGGISILLGVIAACLTVVPAPERWAVLALTLGFGVIGFTDDYIVPKVWQGKRGLGWKQKLAMQILFSVGALWVTGLRDAAALGLGVFVILFFSNAYNFADGMDGLAGGLGVMLAGGLAVIGFGSGQPGVVAAMLALGAAFLPFLVYNRPRAKVFMGDVGALPIGAVIGWSVLALGWHPETGPNFGMLGALAVLSLVMMIELVPVPLQIASVKLRSGKRLFPFKTPVHHGFQSAGWPERRVVGLFYALQWGCVLGAVALSGFTALLPWAVGLALVGLVLAFERKVLPVTEAVSSGG